MNEKYDIYDITICSIVWVIVTIFFMSMVVDCANDGVLTLYYQTNDGTIIAKEYISSKIPSIYKDIDCYVISIYTGDGLENEIKLNNVSSLSYEPRYWIGK